MFVVLFIKYSDTPKQQRLNLKMLARPQIPSIERVHCVGAQEETHARVFGIELSESIHMTYHA
jgi:hypothetical protein